MKCEYCENDIPNGATQCPNCGAPVRKQAAKTYPKIENASFDELTKPNSMGPDSVLGCIIILVVSAVIIALILKIIF